MARTITALFDSRADAEAGRERLHRAGIDAAHVHIHDKASHTTQGDYSTHEDRGMWASIKNAFLPDADRHAYDEGVRRGGVLLTADVDDDNTAAAVTALEDANSVDLDQRTNEWRAQGWAAPAASDAAIDGGYGQRDTDRGGVRFRSYSPMADRDL